ncbi:hypothetical protein SLITK23_02900 [Streptomyces lividans]|uniref:Uncharacterized protein n=1 Tax=Streptomyces lividans 1326 TaxID=1200984 RepID=A0A7U9DNU5_STRLI|nr:predicted protein [Streptomyces lividans TK24]EOY45021.1 hypothetical protein SLI_0302 [Streptomyces lividans 1326]BDE37045.1 hypothetical protein SLITK23_02900 [Streptomyces lividans]GHB88876.1 hypothetical protein GCM10010348_02670 [Streptomyces anthocyanicus]
MTTSGAVHRYWARKSRSGGAGTAPITAEVRAHREVGTPLITVTTVFAISAPGRPYGRVRRERRHGRTRLPTKESDP